MQARSLITASANASALCLIDDQSLKESQYTLGNGCLKTHNYSTEDFELLIETEALSQEK